MKILSFGEIIWDVYPTHSDMGGAPLNFCAHTTLCGDKGYMLSAVGNDDLGQKAIEKIKEYGVNTDFIGISEYETGKCLVTLNESGVPTYRIKDNAAYDHILYPENISNISFDAVYFGNLAIRNCVSFETLKSVLSDFSSSVKFCDINIRPNCYNEDTVRFCLENSDILKISDEDENILNGFNIWKTAKNGDYINIFKTFGNLKVLILTKGSDGAEIFTNTGKHHIIPAIKCKVSSTVGAGDSFSAAFLHSYLHDGDIEKAGLLGAKLSSFVVSSPMAIPKYDIKDL